MQQGAHCVGVRNPHRKQKKRKISQGPFGGKAPGGVAASSDSKLTHLAKSPACFKE